MNKQFVTDYVAAFGPTPRISNAHVTAWDSMQMLYAGLQAQQGQKFDADKFMSTIRGYKFESLRGPVEIDKATGDIIQNMYIRRVERVNGQLQNIEFETIKNVPFK
jgi:branched-chain amino acid transport system substrate-binding protein